MENGSLSLDRGRSASQRDKTGDGQSDRHKHDARWLGHHCERGYDLVTVVPCIQKRNPVFVVARDGIGGEIEVVGEE
jgi:hypothetical protein